MDPIILEPQTPWLMRTIFVLVAVLMAWALVALWVPRARVISIGRKRSDKASEQPKVPDTILKTK